MSLVPVRLAVLALLLLTASAVLSRSGFAATIYAVSQTTGELISYDVADPAGTRTTLLTGGSLVGPVALTLGPDGALYIGENGDGSTFAPRISKFEIDTLTLSTVYGFSAFELFPASLVFQGDDLLIGRNPLFSDTGPVVKLSNATGGVPALSDYTSGGALASSPGLALGADGSLYVSDQTYNAGTGIASGPVKRFDSSGVYIGELIADGASGLAGPAGLAINGNTLYTASVMSGTVLQTNLTTGSTTDFADTGTAFEAGALAPLADGGLLVGTTQNGGNIYHFDASGTLLGTFASGLGTVGGIATLDVNPVPEPGTLSLAAAGLLGAGFVGRRPVRRQRAAKARKPARSAAAAVSRMRGMRAPLPAAGPGRPLQPGA